MGKKDDYAPMHSVEHILNQTMDRMFGCGRSFNAHIEKKKSKCDYRFYRPLTTREITTIEDRVNRVIRDDLPVTEHLVSRSEAENRYYTGKIPQDAGDPIRIIRIGDYDACPCIGRHVGSTGEIPSFRILSTGYANGVLRIRFALRPSSDRS